ncbi:hypothetical protein Aph02nite_77700 [Actinoplanes philippinensis]|uniref:Uncharacterized protein n=2 Tax=Actinoplanes philippinensis TaxID=35752 RepID=A0A1I2HIL1_9ACTN|nr:hypothetical protein [Actinoplanes philippinensis]GIE81820.1 hypothetical protein Aph02nite_77700 [Actinoplanes philippinensis]SFF29130.1 hypothetical protein SAMN05421541_108201 [Actinoplanes philippinensis]
MVDHDDAVARAHRVLLGLAGRVPDEVLAAARLRLAEGVLPDLRESVAHRFSFAASADPGGPALLDLSAGDLDPLDRAAAEAAAGESGARALWRSWRIPATAAPPVRVYVLEAGAAEATLPRLTAAVMTALLDAGLTAPQVETYHSDVDLLPCQHAARGASALIWTRDERPPPRLARVFDRGGAAGVGFDPGHERLSGAERDRVAGYLDGGEPILATTRSAPDVFAPELGPIVPAGFRTDGRWIWTDTVTYYLRTYSLAPDAELLGHIRANDYAAVDVDAAAEHRALALLLTRG